MSALVNHCNACYFNPSHLICSTFQQSRHRISRNLSLKKKNVIKPVRTASFVILDMRTRESCKKSIFIWWDPKPIDCGTRFVIPSVRYYQASHKKFVSMPTTNQTRFSIHVNRYDCLVSMDAFGNRDWQVASISIRALNATARTLFQRRMTWAKR